MSDAFFVKIPKRKAELPAIIVAGILCFIGWAFHFGFFEWQGGAIWLLITVPILGVIYYKRKGDYFVKVNAEGIAWRQGILSKYIFIPWHYMLRVDYLVFEINFQIKESRQVVSFATSGLSETEIEALKKSISDFVKATLAKQN